MTDIEKLTDNPDATMTALVEDILAEATRQGASSACATVGAGSGLSVDVRMGELETVEHHRSKSLGVTVYFGQRTGSASSTDLTPEALKDTVGAACRIARHTQEDDCAGLADAHLMATKLPDLDLYHPWAIKAEEATDLALESEAAARDVDERITNSDGAGVSTYQGSQVYGNTHGFIGSYAGTRHSLSCTVIAEEGEEKQRDYWFDTARRADHLENGKDIGRQAGQRTVRRLGGRQLSTRNAPVVFPADQASRLFGSFVAAIRGSSLYRQATFLLDHLDKPVFPELVQIREEPHMHGALGSSPFDSEGVATEARDLVTDGVLRGYVLDSYSARKLGMQTTGNAGGIHNLIVAPGEKSLDQLLTEMGRGLLISELIGMGVNIVTGDYSRGAAGFWVEDGQIQYPVEEITIAGNLKDMFHGIQAIGTDIDIRSNIHTGSVLIDNMTIAGG